MNPRPPWRPEELALLDSWTGTDAELAQQLGRSIQAIRNQRSRRTPDVAAKQRAYAQGRGARLAFIRQRSQREQLNANTRARSAAEREAAPNSGPYQPEEDAVVLSVTQGTLRRVRPLNLLGHTVRPLTDPEPN